MPMNYKAFLINIQQKNTLFIVFLIAFFLYIACFCHNECEF